MKTQNTKLLLVSVLAVSMVAMSGCGSGGKIVKKLKFASETIDSKVYTGFDATVDLGQLELPYSTIPVMHPKTGVQIGYLVTEPNLIGLRVSVLDVSNLPIESNSATLPNGRDLPISLPAGVIPMSIPVKGTNAKVYFAFGSENIMAGVALTLKVTDTNGTGWDRYLGIPANIFFPFNIDTKLKGTAGIFTGSKFGVGVFAVKTNSVPTIFSGVASASSRRSAPEVFDVKHQEPSRRNLGRISNAVDDVTAVRID